MKNIIRKRKPGHRGPSPSQARKRELFRAKHPEGRKVYSHRRRGHNCHWAKGV